MATKVLPPKLLKNLFSAASAARYVNSSATSSSSVAAISQLTLGEKPEVPILENPPTITTPTVQDHPDILDLKDHQKLFSTVPTKKLLHAALTLHMSAFGPMVDLGTWVMNSRAMDVEITREAMLKVIRHTFYEHFCAGEDNLEVEKCVRRANDAGLRAMLDYAVEFTDDNETCDHNLENFIQSIQTAASLPPSSVSAVVVKITALCPLNLLERVSDLLRWQQKDPSFNLPWKHDSLPIFAESSPLYHTLTKPEPLTPEEEKYLQLGYDRLLRLCQKSVEANVRLVVDAEHTTVQPAIDYFTYSSAIKFNKDDNPLVYGTMQAYLKDAKERLLLATTAAQKMGIPMGIKLVRGAYMSSESKLASSLGFESPIHNSIQDTHDCYNDCASFMLEKINNGSDGVILATHNVESGRLAAKKAQDMGIEKENERFEFAQLYGMSEALSFGLKNAGFRVSKYMPYGPVEKVVPYLLRRAEENRGLLAASSVDRELMRKELKRRLVSAF
ncbi:hypothetical protein Tsubulata_008684 [Turnera subulata]|uniref:Proline dehydrogenase n=1 Tax=Turnera subulata TaxID=218843 RepID=A0A9Q0J1P5_9ROSI|nr:hypothetical protein Tsubulata_008684 [Turnera subulata]